MYNVIMHIFTNKYKIKKSILFIDYSYLVFLFYKWKEVIVN